MDTNQKLDYIIQLLEKKNEPSNVRYLPPSNGLADLRQKELLKIFELLVGMTKQKKYRHGFPKEIRAENDSFKNNFRAPVPEIVPYSILKNRCGLLKAFRPREGESHSGEVFENTLKDCDDLVVRTLAEAGLRFGSIIRCVWSRAEARRAGFFGVVKVENEIEKTGPWEYENVVQDEEEEDFSHREEDKVLELGEDFEETL